MPGVLLIRCYIFLQTRHWDGTLRASCALQMRSRPLVYVPLSCTSNNCNNRRYILHFSLFHFPCLLPPLQCMHAAVSVQAAKGLEPTLQWTPADFQCCVCSKLLFNPVVLNCGHAVCGDTCRPQADAASERCCPQCEATIVGCPSICTQVAAAASPVELQAVVHLPHQCMVQGKCPKPVASCQRKCHWLLVCQQTAVLQGCSRGLCMLLCNSPLSTYSDVLHHFCDHRKTC